MVRGVAPLLLDLALRPVGVHAFLHGPQRAHNDLLHEEIYFFTKNYTGIPVYLSSRDKHLSFEHTHPPHEYILSEDKFKIVANFKKEFYEIIC